MKKETDTKKVRTVKQPEYKSFRLSKRLRPAIKPLPPIWRLFAKTAQLLWSQKWLFTGILAIFAIVQLVLVQGVLAEDFASTVFLYREGGMADVSGLLGGLTLFAFLFGSSGQKITADGGVYQTVLILVVSLALIWALRHVVAGVKVGVRDAYYKGMYPLIPFMLVILVILLQLIPLLAGTWLYYTMIVAGVATTTVEHVFWIILSVLVALPTFYWLVSSIIALYVVTLPDMTPMKALRSARELVKNRRQAVFWRIIALTAAIGLLLAAILVPVIMWLPVAAAWLFYILTVLAAAYAHGYMYVLYRELI